MYIHTFDVGCNGIEAGNLAGGWGEAPEDVVLRINAQPTVGQVLLVLTVKLLRPLLPPVNHDDVWFGSTWSGRGHQP